jgi:uncharacterized protein
LQWKLANLRAALTAGRRRAAAVQHLPLSEADEIAVGKPMKFWREWLEHSEAGDPWWEVDDYSKGAAEITAPNHLISGWYDFMLPQLLRDYVNLEQAGRNPI